MSSVGVSYFRSQSCSREIQNQPVHAFKKIAPSLLASHRTSDKIMGPTLDRPAMVFEFRLVSEEVVLKVSSCG